MKDLKKQVPKKKPESSPKNPHSKQVEGENQIDREAQYENKDES